MVSDLDIFRSAQVLIREHGEDAAQRADAMLERGAMEGVAVWKRVLKAVEEMKRTRFVSNQRSDSLRPVPWKPES